jgi:DNA polymerase I
VTTPLPLYENRSVLLVDGHNFLFRYFRGMPRTIFSSNGQLIHAAYGFVAAVLKQIKRFNSRSVIVSFDSQTPSARPNLVSSYKANRVQAFDPGSADNPFTQLDCITSVLTYLGIPSIEISGVEADDIIGSFAFHAVAMRTPVVITTGDKDYLQLVTDDVCIYDQRGAKEVIYTPRTVYEKFQIRPTQYVDFRALTGDTSDNVKGVPGIGPKTAADLLARYPTIETLFASLEELNPRMALALDSHRDTIFLNKQVLKIDASVCIDPNLINTENVNASMGMSAKQIFTDMGYFRR